MNTITNFKLNCCKLFQKYPLYTYRTAIADGSYYKLHVLLIGYGNRMNTILHEVLTNGQLLNTELNITITSPNASSTYESLMKKASYLKHFATIIVNSKTIFNPKNEDNLCTLHFNNISLTPQSISDMLLQDEYNYIIISTGNDEKNEALAESCSQFIPKHNTLIAYVQKKETNKIKITSPLLETYAFGSTKENTYLKHIEQIALNLYFTYAKAENEHANAKQIINKFYEPYNYISNIESAIHIKSKLACVNINDESLDMAAQNFNKLIAKQPEIVEQLSILEHKRWMMEKLLQGYHQIDDLNLIYSQRGITTHDSSQKWHCCLISCNSMFESHIQSQDWKFTGSIASMTHLDALDQMSLQLHRKCGQIANTNRPRVTELLKSIKDTIISHTAFSKKTLEIEKQMEITITQMYQQKRNAIPLYEHKWNELKTIISLEGKLQTFMLIEYLDLLDNALAPIKEFISFKDYKEADRNFIRKIPFVLSHKIKSTLIKLLSAKDAENVLSLWKLEPESVIFVGCATTLIELRHIRQQADNIYRFIETTALATNLIWHLFIPENIADIKQIDEEIFKDWNCTIHTISTITRSSLTTPIEKLFENITSDYLDITGADPLFSRIAEMAADKNDIPIFYTKNGCIFNLSGAAKLEYESPQKNLTVHEMFSLAGAILEENETEKLSDLSKNYNKFWKIAYNATNWNAFCEFITNAYKEIKRPTKTFTIPTIQENFVNKSIIVKSDVAVALIPIMEKFIDFGLINNMSIRLENDNQKNITFKCPSANLASNIYHGLIELCEQYTLSSFFTTEKTNHIITLTLRDLSVKNITLPNTEYKQILQGLAANKIILNLTQDKAGKWSFYFPSQNMQNAFKKSGQILEYYIYYCALFDGHFTDVNVGWKFQHSMSKNFTENELDVVCTKGTSSLFISAKMSSATALKSNNKLNYTLYEISLLAEHFGINAKPVLAAPNLPQFTFDQRGNRTLSNDVCNALNRGVYLLGKECFQDNVLGKVLDNIIDEKEDWCTFL